MYMCKHVFKQQMIKLSFYGIAYETFWQHKRRHPYAMWTPWKFLSTCFILDTNKAKSGVIESIIHSNTCGLIDIPNMLKTLQS